MNAGGPQIERDRPPYIRFERRPVEDRSTTPYSFKDVDFVLVTPAGSKDVFEREVKAWFEYNKLQIQAGRLPAQWQQAYEFAYEQFKKGQDVPLSGTPLKTWPAISPAQLKTCLDANVRTVEDLACLNDEGLNRVGMGAALLKQRAVDWLRDIKGPGAMAMELTDTRVKLQAAEQKIASQDEQLKAFAAQLQILEARLPKEDRPATQTAAPTKPRAEVPIEDVLEDDPQALQALVDKHKAATQGQSNL